MQDLQHLESFQSLSDRKQQAILALCTAPNRSAAAELAGVSRSTLWRYTQESDFQQALIEVRRELSGDITLKLLAISGEAVEALHRALNCGETNAEIRAAREILEGVGRRLEMEEVTNRLEALERELA
jgi:hypothetical protein